MKPLQKLLDLLGKKDAVDWDALAQDLEEQKKERRKVANLHHKLEWELEMIKARKAVKE